MFVPSGLLIWIYLYHTFLLSLKCTRNYTGEEKGANHVSGLPNGKTSEHLELHDLYLSGTEFKADISISDPFGTLKHECGPAAWFQSTKVWSINTGLMSSSYQTLRSDGCTCISISTFP